jgi:hypothetical protein
MIYTYAIRNTSYSATPCFCSPCYSPLTSLCSPLLTWKPSFGVMRPCPPWSQVARKLTSPFSSPPHPPPFQIPTTPGQFCTLLRRHCDSGFSWSGTNTMIKSLLVKFTGKQAEKALLVQLLFELIATESIVTLRRSH